MLRSAACLTLLSLPAFAAIYESNIVVVDEDDLRATAERGEISDATLQTLLELLDDGIDLDRATRDELYELPGLTYADVDAIIAYRKTEGHIEDPGALVAAGAITEEQLLQIAPFLVIVEGDGKIPFGGHYRLLGAYTIGDPIAPPAYLTVKVNGPYSLTGGIGLAFNRRRVSAPSFDASRLTRPGGADGTLSVRPAGYSIEVPKFYVQWRGAKFRVLAGTFRLGFGQRVTLDNTTRYTPNGIYADDVFFVNRDLSGSCRLSAGEITGTDVCPDDRYLTDDFKWRDSFRGIAFSADNLELGETAHASFAAFASYQTRSIYQYDIFDRRTCDDPRDDGTAGCSSPYVYVNRGDGDVNQARLAFSTLPNLFDEIAAGAHASFSPIAQVSIGITGYAALPRWHVPEMQLDFQEYARYPFGGAFGAVGIDARVSVSAWNFYLEAARSFDRELNGGGGWGVVQRSVWGKKKRELEIIARFYDDHFINPYARPVSSPDEVDGQRARDEAGLRIKYTEKMLGDFVLVGQLDGWALPWDTKGLEGNIAGSSRGYLAGTANFNALLRVNYTGWTFFEPELQFDYRNKDLFGRNRVPDRPDIGACYSSSNGRYVPQFEGAPQLCTGERYRAIASLTFRPFPKKLEIQLTYLHDFVSDSRYAPEGKLGQDLRFTAELTSRPIPDLLFRLRSRYAKFDIFTKDRLEETLWSFVEVSWLTLRPFHVTARYDAVVWLDKRDSTAARVPNPEHRFRLELEGRF